MLETQIWDGEVLLQEWNRGVVVIVPGSGVCVYLVKTQELSPVSIFDVSVGTKTDGG